MTINGDLKYHRALVLSAERLSELEVILFHYCGRISYEATTVNGLNIVFQSKDELLTYDNYGNKRLKELTIIGYRDFDRIFRFECLSGKQWFNIVGYWKTIKCNYTFSNLHDEEHFRIDILSFLRKATPAYWWIGKISTWGLIWLSSTLSTMYNIFAGKMVNYDGSIVSFLALLFVSLFVLAFFAVFDYYVIGNLFPPIVFAWGEELNRTKKYDTLRNNILWCVIIAILVGLFTTYLSNKVFFTMG